MAADAPELTEGLTGQSRSPQSRHGVPRGSLEEAETLAKGLWDAARLGAVPPEALAKQLSGASAKASGGGWRAKLALLRTFGLMENEGSQLRLSPRGRQIVQTQDKKAAHGARREAILGIKAYADLLKASDGTSLPTEASLGATFEFTYGLSTPDARRAAQDFAASIRLAGLLGDGDRVRLAPDDATAHDHAESGGQPRSGDDGGSAVERERSLLTYPSELQSHAPPSQLMSPSGATASGVSTQLNISLDLSQFAIDDILHILRALGFLSDDKASS